MTDPVTLSSAPPARTSMNYAALREGGMDLIRQWAAESWTDHNIHDPGIALLEACSYAMTELGLRLQLNMADLLRSGESYGAPDLEPAHRVLPVGPVDFADLRTLLLDHPQVSDALISSPADSEVRFYQAPVTTNPPLTYTAGTPLVQPSGLYEVLVEFANRDLNGNTYTLQVTSGGTNYDIELGLPYWDDPEAAPFRAGASVNSVAMELDGTDYWLALPEPQSYFGKMTVTYTPSGGAPATIELWVVLSVTDLLQNPTAVLPGILTAARAAVESVAAGSPIQLFATRVTNAVAAVAQLGRYLQWWRNLGEQAVSIGATREQEIGIQGRIEVTGGVDLETLLANIFNDVDALLSPRVRFESLADRTAEVTDPDLIYDGPLLRHGFLSADDAAATAPDVIYTSDILRLIMRRRDGTDTDIVSQENPVGRTIVAVTDLALSNYIDNRPITTNADNCLHLVETERYKPRLSLARSQIVFTRNDSEVAYDETRVASLFADLQAAAAASAVTSNPSPVWPVTLGDPLPVDDYTPIQEDLPANYGVGSAALPASAGVARLAAVKQLKGYLLPFEQILADSTAQLANINRFFSGAADETTTSFTRPLFELSGIQDLLRQFPPGANWATFIADPNNPFAQFLQGAAETPDQFLDRRNRMLDHRLARHGEDTVALGQELHRWAQAQLNLTGLTSAQQATAIAQRRAVVNARLIQIKTAFLHDVPELNAFRFLAGSNPFYSNDTLLQIETVTGGFLWHLWAGGTELLRAPNPVTDSIQAGLDAESAFLLAGRSTLYTPVAAAGGQFQLNLMDGTVVVAASAQTWASAAAATTAAPTLAAQFNTLRIQSSRAPLERRISYLTGMRTQSRLPLLVPTNTYFQIYDDPPGGGLFGKRWRLWQLPAQAGQTLLISPIRFEAATDADATSLAQQSIAQVMSYGIDEWNYAVVPAAGNTFIYQLTDATGTVLALSDPPVATQALAQQGITATVAHLYQNTSAEGFYLVEHLLLRPRTTADAFLSLPVDQLTWEADPYSQRLSFILPSGWARDFTQPHATAPTTPLAPDRFRDAELRGHVERTIQQACPAHLMPSIFWVDREVGGAATATASFDTWEQRYFAWLDTVLIPGAPDATVTAARAALVEALNAIANDNL